MKIVQNEHKKIHEMNTERCIVCTNKDQQNNYKQTFFAERCIT